MRGVKRRREHVAFCGRAMPRLVGQVVEWSTSRGYGFIRSDGGESFFVHHSGLACDSLAAGNVVDFMRQAKAAAERTDQAVSVRVRPQPAPAGSSSGNASASRAAAAALLPRAVARKKRPTGDADARSDGAPPPKRAARRLSGDAKREASVLGLT